MYFFKKHCMLYGILIATKFSFFVLQAAQQETINATALIKENEDYLQEAYIIMGTILGQKIFYNKQIVDAQHSRELLRDAQRCIDLNDPNSHACTRCHKTWTRYVEKNISEHNK